MKNPLACSALVFAMAAHAAVHPVLEVSFEDRPDALTAGGTLSPVVVEGVEYADGVVGRAVRLSASAKSRIEYPVEGILHREEGTIAFWMKPDFKPGRDHGADVLFTTPFDASVPVGSHPARVPDCPSAAGTGALRVWMSTPNAWLRGECYDDRQTRTGDMIRPNEWHHYIFTWDERSVDMYVDGADRPYSDAASPMREAIERSRENSRYFARHLYSRPTDPLSLVLGASATGDDSWRFDGEIDELVVFDRHMGPREAEAFAKRSGVKPRPSVDWTAKFAGRENPYAGPAGGNIDLELVEEIRLDSNEAIERLRRENRFASCGDISIQSLGGVKYAEMGAREGDRIAVRFPGGKTSRPLDFFEVEYPDDGFRTCDMIIQVTGGGAAVGEQYSMQVGYACGHEHPNSSTMQTFRTPYWMPANGSDDLTFVAMTARSGQPAAIAAIRRYHVRDGRLPAMDVTLPAKADGWNRSFALFYEDPSINYDFGAPDNGYTEEGLLKVADACIATMKYAGQDLLAYPGVWYQGLIEDGGYNPRKHAPDFLDGFYARFDAAGLGVVPTLNPNSMPVADGLVTLETMTNGTLHSSPISITATGKPNWGGWHNTPPNFNIQHPEVQAKLLEWVDRLVAQGARHPSFKGICFHVSRHCFLSWGVAEGGYNDYSIEAFERFAGLRVPCDRSDPMRGKAYAEWIRANAWDKWCDFRQCVVSDFYAKAAARVKAARSDLRLWVNVFNGPLQGEGNYLDDDATAVALRNMGVNGEAIEREADRLVGKAGGNVIVAQSFMPSKPRWMSRRMKDGDPVYEKMKVLHTKKDLYANLRGVSFPWIGQHDLYWESPIGKTSILENGGWLNECKWRVSTINPSGRNQLEAFAAPLRHTDALGISKGGFLVGTYGMEDTIRPFVQAFRALPAVLFETVASGDVTVRFRRFDGKSWFYVVNATGERRTVELDLSEDFRDLVSKSVCHAGRAKLELDSWELRSFVAENGTVSIP